MEGDGVSGGDERLYGGGGNDTRAGDGLGTTENGAGGYDSLSGGGGDDLLSGGDGSDVLDGGTGTDTARFVGKQPDYDVTRATVGSIRWLYHDSDRVATTTCLELLYLRGGNAVVEWRSVKRGRCKVSRRG